MTDLHCRGYMVRTFEEPDACAFAAAVRESQSTVGLWMPWAWPDYSEADALAWFKDCSESRAAGTAHEFGIFDAVTGAFVGGIGLNQFCKANNYANLGYWVAQSAQRRGAATAAVSVLLDYAFRKLDLTRVEIVVAEGNQPSIGVATKAGGMHECLARNRLVIHGKPGAAHVFSFVP